jgi:hypothetical protein
VDANGGNNNRQSRPPNIGSVTNFPVGTAPIDAAASSIATTQMASEADAILQRRRKQQIAEEEEKKNAALAAAKEREREAWFAEQDRVLSYLLST